MQKYYGVVQDNSGDTIDGANITVVDNETQNQVNVYDDDEITVLDQPLTSDTSGQFAFNIPAGVYDIQISYGNNTRTRNRVMIPSSEVNNTVDNMSELKTATRQGHLFLSGFYSVNGYGSGLFYWDSGESKGLHDGGTVIDPDHSVTPGNAGWWTAENSGGGCWVRFLETDRATITPEMFGADPTGTDLSDGAFQAMSSFVNKKPYHMKWMGHYRLSQLVTFEGINDGTLRERDGLSITTGGKMVTYIDGERANDMDPIIHFKQGVFSVEGGFSVRGNAIKFGIEDEDANGFFQVVKQSYFCQMVVYDSGIIFGHVFDTVFEGFNIVGTNDGDIPFEILTHATDNCNNILINRMHIETYAKDCTFWKMHGGTGASQKHHTIQVNSLHLEGDYGSSFLDWQYANNITVINPNYVQNNFAGGSPDQNIMLFDSCRAINHYGGQITSTSSKELIHITSEVSLKFDHTFFSSSLSNTSTATLEDLVLDERPSGTSSPLSLMVMLNGCTINDLGAVPHTNNHLLTSGSYRVHNFLDDDNYIQFKETGGRISNNEFSYNKDLFSIGRSGQLGTSSVEIANGSYVDINIWSPKWPLNPFGAFILSHNNGNSAFLSGQDGTPILLSANNVELSATPASGNLGISMPDGNNIRIHNNIGGDTDVVYTLFGF